MTAEQKIEKNKNIFKEVNKTYNVFTKELEEFLGDNFYIAPASASLDMYGCYPGGLLNFLIKVGKYAVKINELLPEDMQINKEVLIQTVFLSQIGKTYLFKINENEWTIKKGRMYNYRDDEMVVMNVGERSAYYAIKYGVNLTEEQYQTILNLDKDENDKFMGGSKSLFHIVKMGFKLALMELKHGKD